MNEQLIAIHDALLEQYIHYRLIYVHSIRAKQSFCRIMILFNDKQYSIYHAFYAVNDNQENKATIW